MSVIAIAQPAADSPAATESARFDVWEYRVLGNTVLPGADVERLLYSQLGESRSLDDVEKARAALEAAYRNAGYGTVFVDIPEQTVNEGVVRLRVTEGTVNTIRVTGTRYFSNRTILAGVPAATAGTVPHLPTVQQELTDLNSETPDRNVVPVLKAGPRPGTVDLTLTVNDNTPLHASVEVNDQYTSDTSRLRAIASLSYDNLWQRQDSLAVQYQTSPEEPSEVAVWAGSYTARLPYGRSKLALFYINSDSDVATVGDAGATVPVLGKGQIFGARFINPVFSSQAATHVVLASAEYKDFLESVFAEDFLRTPISYVNFSAGHTSAWRRERQQWSLASSANFGVRSLGNSAAEFRDKRARGIPNYWLVRGDSSYALRLPGQFSLRWRGAGQFAVDPVISNEQFSVAGADGVRGYLEAEQLGDIGFKTSFEVGTPAWNPFAGQLQAGAFLFYDFGRISRLEPLRNGNTSSPDFGQLLEEVDRSLRSAGAGIEFSALGNFTGSVIWAYPLVNGSRDGGTLEGDSRVHFSLRGSW